MNTIILTIVLMAAASTSAKILDQGKPIDRSGNFELLILHNNDMHARFEQTSQLSGACSDTEASEGKCYGGFARVAHVVKEARSAAAEGRGPPVLYLNAGDTYTGTAWFTLYKWKIAAEFINALQPDAVSLGNHEFDIGISGLTPFVEHLTCPVLAANLILTKVPELASQSNLKSSVVFDIASTKVGIIGYITPETKVLAVTNDVEYIDEVVALKKEVTKLQNEGVHIIIALGHSGYTRDQEIGQEVEGIHLVIGAHSHTFLYNGTGPDSEDTEGPYPTYVTQASGRKIPVVQAYAFTKYLGKLHMIFNSLGELISLDGEPILLDKSIPEDPYTLALLDRYRTEVQNISSEVVGTTSVLLDGRSCEKEECNLGNLIADSVVYHYATLYKGEHWTDAPIAVIQAGGIRSSIAHARITKGDLLTVMPFTGGLVMVEMNGGILLQMLEHSVARYGAPAVGEFLQLSGLKVVYNITMPVGSRVVEAVARCWACNIPKYTKVDNSQIYKVIMSDFISMGGDGFSMLKNLPSQILHFSELVCTEHYIRQWNLIYPDVEGRIIIHKENLHGKSFRVTSHTFILVALSLLSIIVA